MRDLIDIAALLVVRAVVALLAILPDKIALAVARIIVAVVLLFFPRSRSVALKNLEFCFPERSIAERESIYRRSLWTLAGTLMAFVHIPRFNREACAAVAAGSDVVPRLKEMCARGKGVLVIVGHIGTFERNLHLWHNLIGPCSVLARGFGLPRLDSWWNSRREMWGAKVFARKGGYSESLRRLENGETVLMLCDQNVKRGYAIFAPFFGRAAATTKTPAVAVLRTQCVAVFVSAFTDENGVNCIDVEEIVMPNAPKLSAEEQMAAFTAHINSCFERVIKKNPEQWFWIHRRWKTRPEGEPETLYADL